MIRWTNLPFLLAGLGILLFPDHPYAQGDTDPALGLSFPLASTNGRIILSQDILLRGDKVLPQGTVLRTVFLPAIVTAENQKTRRGVDESSFSREIPKTSIRNPLSEVEQAMLARAYKVVWTDSWEFRRALDTAPSHRLRLVLEPIGTNQTPRIEIPDFPDGLCLIGNQPPRVLTVVRQSRAEEAGIRPGDQILEVAYQPFGSTLSEFAESYAKARIAAAKQRTVLPLKIRRTNGEVETLSLRIPPAWVNLLDEI